MFKTIGIGIAFFGKSGSSIGQYEEAVKLIHFFESNPYYHIESNGEALLIFYRERLAGVKEIKTLLDFGKGLNQH